MKSVTLAAVGDISLQTSSNRPPFDLVKGVLAEKDVLFGNLETVLASHGKPKEKAVVLSTSPDKALHLKKAGFDVLNVANNHILDMGPEGFHETLKVLSEHDLSLIGARNKTLDQSWAVVERKGIRLGFLGYGEVGDLPDDGIWINKIHVPDIIKDIECLKHKCDVVIVSLHWGIEKVFYPSPKQLALAHRLIDAGAAIILGHHPHVIQGIEKYKAGLIAYSLGNFQFEFDPRECSNGHDKKTNESFILIIRIKNGAVGEYDTIPVKITEDFMPSVPLKETQDEIHTFVFRVSEPLHNWTITESWWFEEVAKEYLTGNLKSFILRIRRYGLKHFLQCIRWLISPFCLKCYAAIVRRKLKEAIGKA
jgi:hypothetical protein